jgi:heat shock protein HslJ
MKPLILIVAFSMLSCNSTPSNRLPRVDSSATVLNDTPPPQRDTTIKDTTRLGGRWFLQPMLVSDTVTGKIPRLELDLSSKRFTGNTGCNNMSGTFDYTDSSISFNERIVTTKMNCVGYNEKAFIENLLRTNRYRLQNGMLILMFNQTELSHWTRKVVPKPVSNKT